MVLGIWWRPSGRRTGLEIESIGSGMVGSIPESHGVVAWLSIGKYPDRMEGVSSDPGMALMLVEVCPIHLLKTGTEGPQPVPGVEEEMVMWMSPNSKHRRNGEDGTKGLVRTAIGHNRTEVQAHNRADDHKAGPF